MERRTFLNKLWLFYVVCSINVPTVAYRIRHVILKNAAFSGAIDGRKFPVNVHPNIWHCSSQNYFFFPKHVFWTLKECVQKISMIIFKNHLGYQVVAMETNKS